MGGPAGALALLGAAVCTGPTAGVATCVPTSSERPILLGSVTRCDRQGVNRGNGSGSRASPGGRPGAALPGVRGPLDQADSRPARAFAGKAYFYDSTGEKSRAAKARYVGVCCGCGGTRSRAAARATHTRVARPATPARSSAAGPANGSSTRCACGARSTAANVIRLVAHARTRVGAAFERLANDDWSPRRFRHRVRRGRATQRARGRLSAAVRRTEAQFRAAGGHGHAVGATIATSGGAIVSIGRRLTRGPSPKELVTVSSATGGDHSSRHRHQWPTAASRLERQSWCRRRRDRSGACRV